jgi:hypothetical protein
VQLPQAKTEASAPAAPTSMTASCKSLCGNNHIEPCLRCQQLPSRHDGEDAGLDCWPDTEWCDGTDLGGRSCESLGYPGGGLTCDANCSLPLSDCETVIAGKHASASRRIGRANTMYPIAIAVRADGIALAWIDAGSQWDEDGPVVVQRLRPDLAPASPPRLIATKGHGVALAATRSGYVLALATTGERSSPLVGRGHLLPVIEIHALTAAGEPRAGMVLLDGESPYLVTRQEPGKPIAGGPLLVLSGGPEPFPEEYQRRGARLLRDDGTPETADVTLFSSTRDPENASGVFVGDGFLYVESDRAAGVTVVHFDLKGRLVGRHALGSGSVGSAQLSWNGDVGSLTVAVYGTPRGVLWQTVRRDGAPIGQPVLLGSIPDDYPHRSPLVAVGSGWLALLSCRSDAFGTTTQDASDMDIVPVSGAGAPAGSGYHLAHDPYGARSCALSAQSGEAIASWCRGDGVIELVRVSP